MKPRMDEQGFGKENYSNCNSVRRPQLVQNDETYVYTLQPLVLQSLKSNMAPQMNYTHNPKNLYTEPANMADVQSMSCERFTEQDWKVSKTQSGIDANLYAPDSKQQSYLSKNTTLFRDIIETYDQEEKDEDIRLLLKDAQDVNNTKVNVSCLSRLTELINHRKNSHQSVNQNNVSVIFDAGSSIAREKQLEESHLSSNVPTNAKASFHPVLKREDILLIKDNINSTSNDQTEPVDLSQKVYQKGNVPDLLTDPT